VAASGIEGRSGAGGPVDSPTMIIIVNCVDQHASAIHDAKGADFVLTGRSSLGFESRGTNLHRNDCTGNFGQSRFLSASGGTASPSSAPCKACGIKRSRNLFPVGHSSGICRPAACISVSSDPHLVCRADYGLVRSRGCQHRTVLHPQRGHDDLVCPREVCLMQIPVSFLTATLQLQSVVRRPC
jgi:hypothetical protein